MWSWVLLADANVLCVSLPFTSPAVELHDVKASFHFNLVLSWISFFAVPNYTGCFVCHLERRSVQCSVKGKLNVLVQQMATVHFKLSHPPCAVLWKLHSLHLELLHTEPR